MTPKPLSPETRAKIRQLTRQMLDKKHACESQQNHTESPLPPHNLTIGPFLTTGQVAKRLGVGPMTVRNWTRDGLLKAAHSTVGRHARYSEQTILQFVQEKSVRSRLSQLSVERRKSSPDHDGSLSPVQRLLVVSQELSNLLSDALSDVESGSENAFRLQKQLDKLVHIQADIETFYLPNKDGLIRKGETQ